MVHQFVVKGIETEAVGHLVFDKKQNKEVRIVKASDVVKLKLFDIGSYRTLNRVLEKYGIPYRNRFGNPETVRICGPRYICIKELEGIYE